MKSYLILIPIFLFALLQGAFLSLNLVLLTVLIFAAFKTNRQSLWVAFWSGLILDLAKGQNFGLSSLVFLLVAGLIILYSQRFEPGWPPFLTILAFSFDLILSRITNGYLSWLSSLILALLTLILTFSWWHFVGRSLNTKIKLRSFLTR
ncbi:MAG: hypothetical protein NT052_00445 [Candidatus Shapirobacteria bacterium]|nr:hypothetical protein [Candidatus Shapirobacteria bacterium]